MKTTAKRRRSAAGLLLALALLWCAPPFGALAQSEVGGAEAAGAGLTADVYETAGDTLAGAEAPVRAASVYVPGADTAALEAAVAAAEERRAAAVDTGEATSLAALTAAIAAASEAVARTDLTSEQAAAWITALQTATEALADEAELVSRQILPAGEYSLAGRTSLWNYSNPAQPSMGHAALDHSLSRLVAGPGGETELQLVFQPLTALNLTGYLQELSAVTAIYYGDDGYISHYDKTPTTVYSVYEGLTDYYGPTVPGLWYPREIGLPLTPGAEEITVEVFVPVMEAINSGSGTQLARLRLDWTGFDLTGDTRIADTGALTLALAEAGSAPSGYTELSRAALAASVTAGEWLITHNASLSVSQEMTDRRETAIRAIRAALLPVVSQPSTPGSSGGGGGNAETVDPSQDGKYYVNVDLWHAELNKASMGNVAFERLALVVTADGASVIQIATHPVEVSGYSTGITEVEGANVLDSAPFTTNTKFDGEEHEIYYLKVFELDLPDVTSQFLPTRIKVPYTPMDAVGAATDGWLEARFRINWAGVKEAPADAELRPAETTGSGSSSLSKTPAAALRDENTGVRLTAAAGVVPEGAELTVAAVEADAAPYALAGRALAELAPRFVLFDVRLEQSGEELQPNGLVTLFIPIPEGYDPARLLCYRINDDGTATLIKGQAGESFYEVQLNRLSLYALAETAAPAPLPLPQPILTPAAVAPVAGPAGASAADVHPVAAMEVEPAVTAETEPESAPEPEPEAEAGPLVTAALPAEQPAEQPAAETPAQAAGGNQAVIVIAAAAGAAVLATLFIRRRGKGKAAGGGK
ncbi:MAG: hypothetical protein LBS10_00905 [Gracilibacteraceae bacterium]|jgi:hypothetical protein|nr:hypothetical protein [Gracilibacteraceae bacterium]